MNGAIGFSSISDSPSLPQCTSLINAGVFAGTKLSPAVVAAWGQPGRCHRTLTLGAGTGKLLPLLSPR